MWTRWLPPGGTYPAGQEWRYRKVQQHADKPTLEFLSWLKGQKLLKAILCGHCHRYYEERFSDTAMLYAVDATYHAVYFELNLTSSNCLLWQIIGSITRIRVPR